METWRSRMELLILINISKILCASWTEPAALREALGSRRTPKPGEYVTRLYGSDIRMGYLPGCGSCMIKRRESKNVYCPELGDDHCSSRREPTAVDTIVIAQSSWPVSGYSRVHPTASQT
jgi:hypothetical protein